MAEHVAILSKVFEKVLPHHDNAHDPVYHLSLAWSALSTQKRHDSDSIHDLLLQLQINFELTCSEVEAFIRLFVFYGISKNDTIHTLREVSYMPIEWAHNIYTHTCAMEAVLNETEKITFFELSRE